MATTQYTDTITNNASATAAVYRNIPIAANSYALITVQIATRDTGSLIYERTLIHKWVRFAAAPVQKDVDAGTSGIDEITVTGVSIVANGDNVSVDVKYGGSGGVHTSGWVVTTVLDGSLPAAT